MGRREVKDRLTNWADAAGGALAAFIDRASSFLTRPLAVRCWVWRHRLEQYRKAHGRVTAFRKYERMLRVALEARERFPWLFRSPYGSSAVDLGVGARSIKGVIMRLKIEQTFEELSPLVGLLGRRGYEIEKESDLVTRSRRYRVKEIENEGSKYRRTQGWMIVDVGSEAKCEVIERTVEETQVEIVCEGEKELREAAE